MSPFSLKNAKLGYICLFKPLKILTTNVYTFTKTYYFLNNRHIMPQLHKLVDTYRHKKLQYTPIGMEFFFKHYDGTICSR